MSGKRISNLSLVAAACLASVGCRGSDRPATASVRGQVTHQGRPLAGATVAFLCPGAPRPAVGTTDANGRYQLTTFEPNDGAVVGTHVVTVNLYWTESEANLPAVAPGDKAAWSKSLDEAVKRTLQQTKAAAEAKPLLPPKYAERRTSDLRKEVVTGENLINIELTD